MVPASLLVLVVQLLEGGELVVQFLEGGELHTEPTIASAHMTKGETLFMPNDHYILGKDTEIHFKLLIYLNLFVVKCIVLLHT